jgi:hypothetical protein
LADSNRSNKVATGSNASVSTQRGMGWSDQLQVTQIALQRQLAEERERDRMVSTLQFQIHQAQQSVKTDLDLAKAMAPDDMVDDLWKDVLEGRKKVKELGAQLVQMQTEHTKPSEKLRIVDDFLRNAAQKKRPAMTAPPMTPTASKSARSETPCTLASATSNLTDEASTEPPREVRVPSPTKNKTRDDETRGDEDLGYGFCAAGKLCAMPSLALEPGCFSPCGNGVAKHTCNECKGIIHSPLCATGEGSDIICKFCDQ